MMSPALFDIRRFAEPEQVYRVGVWGELDAETAPRLTSQLRRMRDRAARLRLDLSGVTFIDCCGLTALLIELRNARRDGWALEVDHQVSRPVSRIIQMTGVDGVFWPQAPRLERPPVA